MRKIIKVLSFLKVIVAVVLVVFVVVGSGFAQTNLNFVYPVEAAGRLGQLIDGLVGEFNQQHPDIRVTPIFAGGYVPALERVQMMVLGGNPPDIAVVGNDYTLMLVDMDALLPLDDFIAEAGGKSFLDRFVPALLTNNSRVEGTFYAMPFQCSTAVLYYNKDLFTEVGLDPNSPPETWFELSVAAAKLTDMEGGVTKRYGIEYQVSNIWYFMALVWQNGGELARGLGEVTLTDEKAIEAAQFWSDLLNKWKVLAFEPKGSVVVQDLIAGKTAMTYNSTGSLSSVRDAARFNWGTAFLPGREKFAVPIGGGLISIYKDIPKKNQEAAWEFVKWFTSTTEIATRWSLGSGYLALLEESWNSPQMQEYLKEFPQALTAKNQLRYARPQMMVYENSQIRTIISEALDTVMLQKATPGQAFEKAQRQIDQILKKSG
ncbi:ABC transporter substrate-binding protein [Candidatus Aerophobetes bacterium]|nr:ABC transporter substrate-binding protein [Candidatus Aerophobetes bacterium]